MQKSKIIARSLIKAFTQVELVSAVAIIGALATISIPRMMAKPEEAKALTCISNIVIMDKVSDIYLAQKGKAASLDELINDRNTFPDGPPKCPFGETYIMGQYGHVLPHQHAISQTP